MNATVEILVEYCMCKNLKMHCAIVDIAYFSHSSPVAVPRSAAHVLGCSLPGISWRTYWPFASDLRNTLTHKTMARWLLLDEPSLLAYCQCLLHLQSTCRQLTYANVVMISNEARQ